MKSALHTAGSEAFVQLKSEVETAYPGLRVSLSEGRLSVAGTFPVQHAGSALDFFRIRVEVPESFPLDLPVVFETEGRIPWTANRHVESCGKACLFVPDERWKYFPESGTLLEFLRGPVHAFFLSQHVFEKTGAWPFGARSHGVEGIAEAYAEELGSADLDLVCRYLDVLRKPEVKGHWPCPCGSGRKLRDCHQDQVQALRAKISPRVATDSWQRVSTEVAIRRRRRAAR